MIDSSYSESLNPKATVAINCSIMKYLNLTFVFLATIFIYQSEASAIQDLERELQQAVAFLTQLEENLNAYGDEQFNNTFNEEAKAITVGIVDTLKDIQKKVDLAAEGGVDAKKCYDSAASHFDNVAEVIFSELEKCFTGQKPDLSIFSKKISLTIVGGLIFQETFTSIRKMCESDAVAEGRCVSQYLLKFTAMTQSYKNRVENVKENVDKAITEGFNNISLCMESPLTASNREFERVIDTADKCIKSA